MYRQNSVPGMRFGIKHAFLVEATSGKRERAAVDGPFYKKINTPQVWKLIFGLFFTLFFVRIRPSLEHELSLTLGFLPCAMWGWANFSVRNLTLPCSIFPTLLILSCPNAPNARLALDVVFLGFFDPFGLPPLFKSSIFFIVWPTSINYLWNGVLDCYDHSLTFISFTIRILLFFLLSSFRPLSCLTKSEMDFSTGNELRIRFGIKLRYDSKNRFSVQGLN